MEKKVPGILNRQLAKMEDKKPGDYSENQLTEVNDLERADLVTSQVKTPDGTVVGHAPVLDIDKINVQVVPSTTPGNYHLYIDRVMDWKKYERLLTALYECGIIEYEYYYLAIRQKYTAVRLPWIKKEMSEEDIKVRALREKLKADPDFPDSLLIDPNFSRQLREQVRAEIALKK